MSERLAGVLRRSVGWLAAGLMMAGAAFGQGGGAMKPMAREADPSFEVATIKPNDSGVQTLMGIKQQGRTFTTTNSSLIDLIGFAYGVQGKQVDVPKGFEKDRYDITGVADVEGIPNITQQRTMVQKMLADRFKLKYHEDKREMPSFVMTQAKDGAKLTPTTIEGVVPITSVHPSADGWVLELKCASSAVIAGFLQLGVLDRPVVDHTGLTARYDLTVDFTPDSSQFHGQIPARQMENPAPALFDALQQQLGLKLTSEKAMVDVVVVDHAEKPSGN